MRFVFIVRWLVTRKNASLHRSDKSGSEGMRLMISASAISRTIYADGAVHLPLGKTAPSLTNGTFPKPPFFISRTDTTKSPEGSINDLAHGTTPVATPAATIPPAPLVGTIAAPETTTVPLPDCTRQNEV